MTIMVTLTDVCNFIANGLNQSSLTEHYFIRKKYHEVIIFGELSSPVHVFSQLRDQVDGLNEEFFKECL